MWHGRFVQFATAASSTVPANRRLPAEGEILDVKIRSADYTIFSQCMSNTILETRHSSCCSKR